MAVAANKRSASRRSRCRAASRRSRCPTCSSCCRPAASPACWSCAPTGTSARCSSARGRSTSPASRDQFDISPRKAIFRMLTWTHGHVRARAARRIGGAGGDGGVDRGAADGGHAPARRVPRDRRRSCPTLVVADRRPAPAQGEAARAVAGRAGRVPGGDGGEDRQRPVRSVVAQRPRDRRRSWSRCSRRATWSPGSGSPRPRAGGYARRSMRARAWAAQLEVVGSRAR